MKAHLRVIRSNYTKDSTIGTMYLNDKLFCFTLEDVCRDLNRDGDLADKNEVKIHGETCIPAGSYKVIINMSNRFKTMMPLLINVPGFEGVRIHAGNTKADTHGCLLVGKKIGLDTVLNSKVAFSELMSELTKYSEIELEIIDSKIC
jgi:hypothetical protein